jgi:hypothetical protein
MRLSFLILPAALLFLAGCSSVESVKPLSSPRAAVPDHRLEGLWGSTDKGSSGYIYIAYPAHIGTGSLMAFGQNDKRGIGKYEEDFFVTRTAKHNYMNMNHTVIHTDGEVHLDRSGHYSFAAYHFTLRGQLVYAMANPDAFAKAVQTGKLRGKLTYDKNKNVTDTLLKDSSERILAFIESSKPGDLFSPATKMNKLGNR